VLSPLNQRIRQGECGSHQQRGQRHAGENRLEVEPHLASCPHPRRGVAKRRIERQPSRMNGLDVDGRQPQQRRGDHAGLRHHQPVLGPAHASVDEPAHERAESEADQQHRQHRRKHSPELAEQDREHPQPQDLRADRGEAGEGQRDAREGEELA
jgi:hypothetical protein